ncbi:GNAT family N-acetyltransferase [Curtobacterium pusillum]|uniref:GNAT family N-acetyltransferase n=1 Tax=Curtobacterium pusillum TaxID=69373 RepID=A0ABX2M7U9_9MICO|nr:GNAT family N-acetyltransferase [Curtobacterium pusillum]NUU13453.1 GNAT family N-acetyltransferase [Curtobacterium pusillum]GLK29823.1 N-acetyltransferase [Curtobacterium pusillum]
MTLSVESITTWSDADVSDVTTLVRLLGHVVDEDAMRARLERLTPEAGHRTWVVRGDDGYAVAIAGAQVTWAYASDEPTAQLLLLVVDPSARRHGTGSALIGTFETWAVEQGARRLSAVSAAATDSAHRFYQKRGYHEAGVRYTKIA